MKQKSLSKNAVINFIKAIMNIIFPIISFPYASRILLPDGIGKVNFANSLIEYFVLVAGLGISGYATREAAKIRDDREKISRFTSEILTINLISTLFAYLLLIIAFIVSSKFQEYRLLILISATKILFSTLGMEWLYNAYEEFSYITIRQTLFQIISLVLLFTLVKTHDDYAIYCCIGVFANVGSYLLNFIYSRKFADLYKYGKIELKKHLKAILTFFGISCVGKINGALDTVMLGFIIGPAAVGLYSASTKLTGLVTAVITSVLYSFMPRSSYYVENDRHDDYKVLVNKVCNVAFFFSIPAGFGLFFLCKVLIEAFTGIEYLSAVPCMKVMSLCVLFQTFCSFLGFMIITPLRKEKFSLIAQIIAIIVNIVFNLLFIRKLEVLGAALATMMVEFIVPLILLIPSWEYIKNKQNFMGGIKSIIGAIIMYIVLKYTCTGISNCYLSIIVSIIVGSITYGLIEVILRHPTCSLVINIIKAKFKSIFRTF